MSIRDILKMGDPRLPATGLDLVLATIGEARCPACQDGKLQA